MSYQHLTDDALVNLLTRSDEKAFEEIYLRHWQRVFRFALGKISTQEIVEDICHDVFLSVWQRRSRVEIGNLEAYLIQAVKYSVINYYKSRVSDEKHLGVYAKTIPGDRNETEDALYFNSLQQAWLAALDALPEKTKTVFQFSRIDHLSNREIAGKLQLTEKAVEYHITKALRQLKGDLKDFFLLCLLAPGVLL
ncbi:RNA polymerase sigma factor [Flavitalea antarctica]